MFVCIYIYVRMFVYIYLSSFSPKNKLTDFLDFPVSPIHRKFIPLSSNFPRLLARREICWLSPLVWFSITFYQGELLGFLASPCYSLVKRLWRKKWTSKRWKKRKEYIKVTLTNHVMTMRKALIKHLPWPYHILHVTLRNAESLFMRWDHLDLLCTGETLRSSHAAFN